MINSTPSSPCFLEGRTTDSENPSSLLLLWLPYDQPHPRNHLELPPSAISVVCMCCSPRGESEDFRNYMPGIRLRALAYFTVSHRGKLVVLKGPEAEVLLCASFQPELPQLWSCSIAVVRSPRRTCNNTPHWKAGQ